MLESPSVKDVKGAKMNNQSKPRKIHELIGTIQKKELRKSYDKTSPYYGSTFYRLQVALENSPVERIYVYKDYLEKEQVWKDIIESGYIDQRYLFYCAKSRKTGNHILINWKVLKTKEFNHA